MLLTLDLLTPDEVTRARALLAQGRWVDGRGTAGEQATQAKRNEQLDPQDEATRQLQALVLGALDRSPAFLSAALPRKVHPPAFNRYTPAHPHYSAHVDNAIRYPASAANLGPVRTDLSCTVFLSEPDDYDGGELIMHGPQGELASQHDGVKLRAGQAVLYPATLVHEVRPVTRGARLASFFWVQSLVRSGEQRRLLLELDQALMGLRTRHRDDPATVALTGTYHNLLRLWAET